MKTNSIAITVFAFAMLASPLLIAEEGHQHDGKNGEEVTKKDEVKPYKPDTCIVSGEKLGEMGEPFVFIHEGQEIKLCCKDCRKKFDRNPARYLKKLEQKK